MGYIYILVSLYIYICEDIDIWDDGDIYIYIYIYCNADFHDGLMVTRVIERDDRDDHKGHFNITRFVALMALAFGLSLHGSPGISEMEFMKALFPLDYRRIYRRMSGMTFGA